MTSLISSRRRADEFAAAVDGNRAVDSTQLASLVGVARSLRTTAQPTPRAAFSAALREQLMAEAQTALVRQATLTLPVRRKGTHERRLAAAASAFVLIGGTAGVAAAAQNALPGDALYPIKRGIERAQADLSTASAGKGRYLLDQASGRLDEVEGLLNESSDTQVPSTITDFTIQAREGASLLFASFEETRDPEVIRTIRVFAANGLAALQVLAEDAPADAQDELALAARTMRDIDAEASALCGSCASDLPDLQVPAIFLASADATTTIRRLEGRTVPLANAHPVVDPKLLKDVEDAVNDAGPEPDPGDGGGSTTTGSENPPLTGDVTVDDDLGLQKTVDEVLTGLTDLTGSLLSSTTESLNLDDPQLP
jgi:hypothetical protein